MTTAAQRAVIFDIDGTLIDSNYLHVDAWQHALLEVGHVVPAARIHSAIGMGSDKLLPALIGDAAAREQGEKARLLHSAFFAAHRFRLRRLPGARELLHAVADAGVSVVLATSAAPRELAALLEVLDTERVDVTTSADDVNESKPDPAILEVALRKAGVDASQSVFLGDAVWDVQAARRSGVPCIGVLSGGTGEAELRDAGAVAVYADAQALLEDRGDPLHLLGDD